MLPYPHLHLLVSGGNSQLIYMRSWTDWEILGATLDDAAGECFDKTGRMLGLPYPGGIYISKIAFSDSGNLFNFPVGMKKSDDYNFSFSGLKTAVRYHLEKIVLNNGEKFILEKPVSKDDIEFLTSHNLNEIEECLGKQQNNNLTDPNLKKFNFEILIIIKKVAISVETVIVESLVNKVSLADKNLEIASIGLSGGVSANPTLRRELEKKFGDKILLAPKPLTGDNAVMIGLAGILDWKNQSST